MIIGIFYIPQVNIVLGFAGIQEWASNINCLHETVVINSLGKLIVIRATAHETLKTYSDQNSLCSEICLTKLYLRGFLIETRSQCIVYADRKTAQIFTGEFYKDG